MKKKSKEKESKITKDMTFAEVLQRYPATVNIFLKHGMSCVGCPLSRSETIEQGASVHGIDVKKLVDELNKKTKENKRKK
jgi:hybrid cluster-associated redox disulfide protein